MLIHLYCSELKNRMMASRKTIHCSLRTGYLSSASRPCSPQRLYAGNEPEKKLWEVAEWDGCFQSWSQHILSGEPCLFRWNVHSEDMLPLKYGRRVGKKMLLLHFMVVLTAQCLTSDSKHLAVWLSENLELQVPTRNLVQLSHFRDGETKF